MRSRADERRKNSIPTTTEAWAEATPRPRGARCSHTTVGRGEAGLVARVARREGGDPLLRRTLLQHLEIVLFKLTCV